MRESESSEHHFSQTDSAHSKMSPLLLEKKKTTFMEQGENIETELKQIETIFIKLFQPKYPTKHSLEQQLPDSFCVSNKY